MNAQSVSGTATYHSNALYIPHLTNCAFKISWDGTVTGNNGSVIVEVSMEGTDYSDLGMAITSPNGSPGFDVINIQGLAVQYVRVTYTNASGSGTMSVKGSARGI